VASTMALCLSHLRAELEGVEGPASSGRPGTVSGALVVTLSGLSLAVLAGSALVFVAMPRFSAGLLHRAGISSPGVPEHIRLGGVGVLKEDPTPVMRVRFPEGAPPPDVYWRTMIFQSWDGASWNRPRESGTTLTSRTGRFRLGNGSAAFTAEVELLGHEPAIPLPGNPLAITFTHRPRDLPPILVADPDGTLEVRGAQDPLRYQVTTGAQDRRTLKGRGRAYPADVLALYTQLPPQLDPRVRELGEKLAAADPLDAVSASLGWLGQLRYTRELPGELADPLATFLFERRAGHCEFFATALTVLLRVQGIPARVAAGYYGISPVEGGDYWLVRRGDAHAWTEVFFPGEGWVRFDATPAGERAGDSRGAYARMLELVDVVRARWAELIVDFDETRQARLAEAVVDALSSRHSAGRRLGSVARVTVVVLSVLGALLLAWRLRRLVRRNAPDPRYREAIGLLRAVKRAARRRGVSLPAGATAEEWGHAAARADPERAVAFRRALVAYQHARFGGRPLDAADARKLRRAL
jgi:transglutaminase-like putative cysteine protease